MTSVPAKAARIAPLVLLPGILLVGWIFAGSPAGPVAPKGGREATGGAREAAPAISAPRNSAPVPTSHRGGDPTASPGQDREPAPQARSSGPASKAPTPASVPAGSEDGWKASAKSGTARLVRDPAAGDTGPGPLRIVESDPKAQGTSFWAKEVDLSGAPGRYRFSARVKTAGLGSGSLAFVNIILSRKREDRYEQICATQSPLVRENTDWKELEVVIDVSVPFDRVLLVPSLHGPGEASFDNLAFVRID